MINYLTLKTELQTDPRGYGYAAPIAAGSDQLVADLANAVRNGTNPPATPLADGGQADGHISINRPDCSPSEILEAIDVRDFVATPAGVVNIPLTQSWLESITQFSMVRLANADGTKTTVRKNIDRLVGTVQGSQGRLDAVAVRFGSRAEEKLGAGVFLSATDVGVALRNT